MRSAQKARMNSESPSDKFCGIIPVSEDWHIKANFLGVGLFIGLSLIISFGDIPTRPNQQLIMDQSISYTQYHWQDWGCEGPIG